MPSTLTFVEDLTIDGRAARGDGERLAVLDPATEKTLAEVPAASAEQVDAAVAAARRAFDEGPWPRLDPAKRAEAIRRFAGAFEARAEELVATIVHEVGTPIS